MKRNITLSTGIVLALMLALAAFAFAQTEDTGTTTFDFSTVPDEEIFFVDSGEVTDGVLDMDIPEEGEGFIQVVLPVTDYRWDMDITFSSYADILMFFTLRLQEETGLSFDVLYYPTFGEAFAGPFADTADGEWDITTEVSDITTMNIDQTYKVSLIAQGSTYRMLIDDEEIIASEDDMFTEGFVGFISITGPAQLTIDNMVITQGDIAAPASDATPEPSSGGLFGGSSSSDDDDASATTPEPSSGGLFGGSSNSDDDDASAPTTEPSSGGLFGNN